MPNADAKNEPLELLAQIEAENRQILSQIESINLTIRPWLDELKALKDYRNQLLDLHETIQRRAIKPRIVTAKNLAPKKESKPKHSSQENDILKMVRALTPEQLLALTQSLDVEGDSQHDFLNVETEEA